MNKKIIIAIFSFIFAFTATFVSAALTLNTTSITSDGVLTLTPTTNLVVSSGNVGIGDASPVALLTVGDGELFQVDSTGNLTSTVTNGIASFAGQQVTSSRGPLLFSHTLTDETFGGQSVARGIWQEAVLNFGTAPTGFKTYRPYNLYVTVPAGSLTTSQTILEGFEVSTQHQSAEAVNTVRSFFGTVNHKGTGTATSLQAYGGNATVSGGGTATTAIGNSQTVAVTTSGGTIGTAIVNRAKTNINHVSANVTTLYHYEVQDLINTGTIGTTYGVYVGDITTGTQTNTPYSFYASDAGTYNYFAGNVGIGTTNPGASNLLELSSTTKGLVLPRMTKAQRDAIATPVAGMAVYQTDNTPGLRVYNGTNWMRFTETAD